MRKTSAVLLAAVVVVLGLVAFAPPTPEPTVVAGAVIPSPFFNNRDVVLRFWSDGTVDSSAISHGGSCVLPNVCGPPIVVIP